MEIKQITGKLQTGGDDLWSNAKKTVDITDVILKEGSNGYGYLRVFFSKKSWNTEVDGLIYTDRLFLALLRDLFIKYNLPGKFVDYSEQGLQKNTYVHLDAEKEFVKAWKKQNRPVEYA